MIRRSLVVLALLNIGILLGWLFHAHSHPPTAIGQSTGSNAASPFVNPRQAPPGNVGAPAGQVFWPEQSTEEIININVYETCNRGVVNISTKIIRPTSFFTESSVEGSGSGAVIDRLGHIVTNFHVIDGAREINVTIFTGESYPAILVGQDPDNDIAVLRISAPEESLFPIAFGDSGSLRVGQHIIAIGNPFGYDRTMSTGIISSLNRLITSKTNRKMKSIIQIDAALNQGNSGGPLLNSRGELIGINTAIATSTGDNAGIGFAIPVNTIARVVPQLIQNGRVSRPTIGIIEAFQSQHGLLILRTAPGGPAEKAGLQGVKLTRRQFQRGPLVFEQSSVDQSSADLITGVDGQSVKTADDFLSIIESKKAGDVVRVRVIRKGREIDVPVTLGADD